jgi:hypothetical protein
VHRTTKWLAYPQFAPPEKFAPFELAPGLYYANALENALSVIECGFVSARNIQLLIQKYIKEVYAEMNLAPSIPPPPAESHVSTPSSSSAV